MANSGNDIKMDTTVYTQIVDNIDNLGKSLLESNEYVEPDAECLLNVVVPDYKVAYESTIDSITSLQERTETVVTLMRNIKTNYDEKIDQDMSDQLNDAAGNSSSSDG
ncbi:hypothetical protein [Butyrivibrio proteoclasticus]|uniref:hypothetical protein n=1 Tax=Butyrivibrio proteoclasticus TaxID=43305 RepID=UPI00047C9D97|nr:hypothetical protein [Butyrivibrio proteoclasticus]